MKSVRRRFLSLKNANPGLSDLNYFTQAIEAQGFNRRTLREWLNVLVDPTEYQNNETSKREVLTYLTVLSQPREDNQKQGSFSP